MDYKQERLFIKNLLASNDLKVSSVQRYKDDDYLRWAYNHREVTIDGWKLRLFESIGFSIGGGETTETECYYSKL